MCNTPLETMNHLPSPPLSPSHSCDKMEIELTPIQIEETKPYLSKMEESYLTSPTEYAYYEKEQQQPQQQPLVQSQSLEEVYQNKFLNYIYNGIPINDHEVIPYDYFIEKLHTIGGNLLNKKTSDAVLLKVYEINEQQQQEEEEEKFLSFWVHPLYLSLQSYQFFKLFEEINSEGEESGDKSEIEIEVPSLQTFPSILHYLYTGKTTSLVNVAKMDENLCKGIIENIKYFNLEKIFSLSS